MSKVNINMDAIKFATDKKFNVGDYFVIKTTSRDFSLRQVIYVNGKFCVMNLNGSCINDFNTLEELNRFYNDESWQVKKVDVDIIVKGGVC